MLLAELVGANAFGVDGAGTGAGAYGGGGCDGCDAYIGGGCDGCDAYIGGGCDGCDAYIGGGAYDAGIGIGAYDACCCGCEACIGGGAYDGGIGSAFVGDIDGGIGIGIGLAAHAGSGGGSVGERGFIEDGDDARGAEGATDGPDRGADGSGAIDGARGAIGAFEAMRFVAGTMLVGALLTGGFFSTFVSSGDGSAAVCREGAGAFAAGATPDIVFFRCAFERRAAPGRAIRDPVSALGFRPSVPKTAPMRKL